MAKCIKKVCLFPVRPVFVISVFFYDVLTLFLCLPVTIVYASLRLIF